MELSEIKKYTHKINKIYVQNSNIISQYQNVIIKIHIDDKKNNEIIRFSLSYDSDWLNHQELNDDYFLEIPNKLNDILILYVHYLPVALYDYLEEQQVFSIYNWNDIVNNNISASNYQYHINDNDELIVQSILHDSIDNTKNPNYKHYTKLYQDNQISNETESGFFPLSSRYRGYSYLNAPDLNIDIPYWQHSNDIPSNCKDNNRSPYWEVKISRENLSPLIGDTQDDKYLPINVYFNYEYLPSSTEYHQHYFGFEPIQSNNNTFNVLDSEELININNAFGSDSTYRIIHQGNPFDDQHTITIDHTEENIIDLSHGVPFKENNKPTCKWERDTCNNFWVYTPLNPGYVSIKTDLEENATYKLQYYIYIPSDTNVENDSCYISVEHIDNNGNLVGISDLIHNNQHFFIQQDKKLRNQWIYHEIDFTAEYDNRIIIKGPQHHNEQDVIFFTNLQIIKVNKHSPVLKYTETGLYLTESSEYTKKSISDNNINCTPIPINEDTIKPWVKKNNLPTPTADVLIYIDDDFDIYYNESTSELLWIPNKINIQYDNDELKYSINDIISFEYDTDNTLLNVKKPHTKHFINGPNNSFTVSVKDKIGNKITSGKIKCAITDSQDSISNNNTIIDLGINELDANGYVYYQNINLAKLQPTKKTYYLTVIYINACDKQQKIYTKQLLFDKEYINIYAYIDNSTSHNPNIIDINSLKIRYGQDNIRNILANNQIYQICNLKWYNENNAETYQFTNKIHTIEDLPIHIGVKLYNQFMNIIQEGYCELSVNDRTVQSSSINSNGIADFYLDYEDIYGTLSYNNYNDIYQQNIKIECFDKKGQFLDYIYFNIQYDIEHEYDTRPAVPIKIYNMFDEDNSLFLSPINMNKKDALLINIDTEDYTDFHLKIIRKKNNIQQTILSTNITEPYDEMLILLLEYDNQLYNVLEEEYIIQTSSMTGQEESGLYRQNQRKIIINWNR